MGAEGIEPPLNPDVAKESDELRIAAPVRSAETRTGAPPPQDLLGQYIFTTYHLLLKEIRNEANGTEIVDLRNSVGYVPTFLVEPIGVRSQSTQTREKPSIVDPEARPAESPFPAPLPGMKELDKDA